MRCVVVTRGMALIGQELIVHCGDEGGNLCVTEWNLFDKEGVWSVTVTDKKTASPNTPLHKKHAWVHWESQNKNGNRFPIVLIFAFSG